MNARQLYVWLGARLASGELTGAVSNFSARVLLDGSTVYIDDEGDYKHPLITPIGNARELLAQVCSPICGIKPAVDSQFECGLPRGHLGDHQTTDGPGVVGWRNEP